MATANPYRLSPSYDDTAMTLSFKVIDRETDEVVEGEELELNIKDLSPEMLKRVTCYGASKIVQDRTSSVTAGPGKCAAIADVWEALLQGEWSKPRERGTQVVSAEVEALAAIMSEQQGTPVSVPAIQKSLGGYSAEQRKAILGSDAVQERAAQIVAERAGAEALDLSGMLG